MTTPWDDAKAGKVVGFGGWVAHVDDGYVDRLGGRGRWCLRLKREGAPPIWIQMPDEVTSITAKIEWVVYVVWAIEVWASWRIVPENDPDRRYLRERQTLDQLFPTPADFRLFLRGRPVALASEAA